MCSQSTFIYVLRFSSSFLSEDFEPVSDQNTRPPVLQKLSAGLKLPKLLPLGVHSFEWSIVELIV